MYITCRTKIFVDLNGLRYDMSMWVVMGWQDSLEVCTVASELSRLGSNVNRAKNSHPDVSQARQGINVCAVYPKDVKPTDLSPRHF